MGLDMPFDGAISAFFENHAPKHIHDRIKTAHNKEILADNFPFPKALKRSIYEDQLAKLQLELVKLQADVKASNKRVVVVFEGRDAAGKGGTIKRIRENLNPRVARVVALPKPSDREAREWYFQRYIRALPAAGEMVLFDRSWYNRAVVEHVFGFCSADQRESFFAQLPNFEDLLTSEGITLVKIWLNVGRAEQLRRFLGREQDPLKQWKLSRIDVEGLHRWDAYSQAISETFDRTHRPDSPWHIIRADDKRRARIAAIETILKSVDYKEKNADVLTSTDPQICGTPSIWSDH